MTTPTADELPDNNIKKHAATDEEKIASENGQYENARANQHALLRLRHAPSSFDDASHNTNHRHRRIHQGLKFLDLTAKPRGTHIRSQPSQGSGFNSDAAQSPAASTASFPATTRKEFESLPPTIRRKCFSTLERLRFASDQDTQDSDITRSASLDDNLPRLHSNIIPATAATNTVHTATTTTTNTTTNATTATNSITSPTTCPAATPATAATSYATSPTKSLGEKKHPARLAILSRLLSDSTLGSSLSPASKRPTSALARLHSSPASDRCNAPDPTTTHTSGCLCSSPLSARHSIILDATDEALIKRARGRRTVSFDMLHHRMHSCTSNGAWMDGRIKETETSLYDSFRWLEDDKNLDLSLDLDDYHFGLRQDVASRESRSSLFRRKLSVSSKMAFARTSSSLSHPSSSHLSTQEAPTPIGGSITSIQNSLVNGNSHTRKRSRALSLISTSRQSCPEPISVSSPSQVAMDPAAHYQDPEARMKLRVYLASPHKFDEAVEFGFPSTEQQPLSPISSSKRFDPLPRSMERNAHARMQTLVEDRRCSLYSEETTATEPDSPRTPEALEKPVPLDDEQCIRETPVSVDDYSQTYAHSREMTLRMTLTRPDLRANEEELYAWQKNCSTSYSDSSHSRLGPRSEDDSKRNTIERQLAAIDQENLLCPEQGAMKRLWNRVRRV